MAIFEPKPLLLGHNFTRGRHKIFYDMRRAANIDPGGLPGTLKKLK
jgi:hypothetical protein